MSDFSTSINSFQSFSNKRKVLSILGFLFIIILFFWLISSLTGNHQPRTVSTVGIGKKSFVAASAKISFVYYTQSSAKGDVATRGKEEFATVLNTIQGMGITSISQGTSQVIPVNTTTYEFRQAALIEVSELSRIKYVLQSLEGMSNVLVLQTSYLPANENTASSDLYSEAMKDAVAKAQRIATFSKGRLGKVLYVTEVAAADAAGSSVTQSTNQSSTQTGIVDSNNIELQKNLTVTFELQ